MTEHRLPGMSIDSKVWDEFADTAAALNLTRTDLIRQAILDKVNAGDTESGRLALELIEVNRQVADAHRELADAHRELAAVRRKLEAARKLANRASEIAAKVSSELCVAFDTDSDIDIHSDSDQAAA